MEMPCPDPDVVSYSMFPQPLWRLALPNRTANKCPMSSLLPPPPASVPVSSAAPLNIPLLARLALTAQAPQQLSLVESVYLIPTRVSS